MEKTKFRAYSYNFRQVKTVSRNRTFILKTIKVHKLHQN